MNTGLTKPVRVDAAAVREHDHANGGRTGRTSVGTSRLIETLSCTAFALWLYLSLTPVARAQGGAPRAVLRALGRAVAEHPKTATIGAGAFAAVTYSVVDQYVSANLQGGEFIYSLDVTLDPGAGAVFWSRWFGRPNLTALVQVEGAGEYWIPQVYPAYRGGPLLWSFAAPKIPAGRKLNVVIFDDKTDENAALNALMRTKMYPSLAGRVSVAGLVQVNLTADTSFQILSGDQPDLPLINFNPICSYTVTCPDPWFNFDNRWSTEGTFFDFSNKPIGQITFKQLGGR